jgi:hypothetical protein
MPHKLVLMSAHAVVYISGQNRTYSFSTHGPLDNMLPQVKGGCKGLYLEWEQPTQALNMHQTQYAIYRLATGAAVMWAWRGQSHCSSNQEGQMMLAFAGSKGYRSVSVAVNGTVQSVWLAPEASTATQSR